MSYIYIYICLVAMQSIDLKIFMKNVKSVVLAGQKVLTRQSLAGPDNVWPGVG
jgi:hypothetical protein